MVKRYFHFNLTLGTNMQHRATVALRLTLKHMVMILQLEPKQMGTNANQMMQVVYMVKAMYLASLKLAGTLRVFEKEKKKSRIRKNVVTVYDQGFFWPSLMQKCNSHFQLLSTSLRAGMNIDASCLPNVLVLKTTGFKT